MGTNLAKPQTSKPPKRVFGHKRGGVITKVEQALINQFVQDQPQEVTNGQVLSLARTLRRSPEVVRNAIQKARDEFVEKASDYVDLHMQATSGALLSGDYQTAAKASEWAMENLSAEGVRIIDKVKEKGPAGPKVMVGIKLGGVGPLPGLPAPSIEVEAVEVPASE